MVEMSIAKNWENQSPFHFRCRPQKGGFTERGQKNKIKSRMGISNLNLHKKSCLSKTYFQNRLNLFF